VLPDLPPLKDVVARHGIAPSRALGQHFLFDANITDKIVAAAGDVQSGPVYEVGPGPGGLTRSLLAAGARKLVVVENDQRCFTALEELSKAFPGRMRILQADAMIVNEAQYAPPGTKIVANLPYNISTPLLLKWLKDAKRFASMTLMFQKEVALRLVATPSTADYGRLSIITQWLCEAKRLFDVEPGSFVPPPKVTSSVVQLVLRAQPLAPARWEHLEKVVAAAFGQRRKMLRVALKTLNVNEVQMIAAAGLNGLARGEGLTVTDFCALSRAYQSQVGGKF
jgi:16S rRNA (adenine1518-N6/adenine1519-N6)-dimethyltransferase